MILKIRNAGEEREEEPMITQKAFHRVVEQKDNQYKEMRDSYEHKAQAHKTQIGIHVHNERNYVRIIKEKERLTYFVGGIAYFLGGLTAWLIA